MTINKLVLTAVGGDIEETLILQTEAQLVPGPEDVVVEVEAAPVNGADSLFAAGWFGVYPQVPADMGAEGVGRVVDVGSEVAPALIGQRVIMLPSFGFGTWATKTVVPARNVVPVPDEADALQLAMLAVNPAAAYSLLHDYVQLQPGDWVGLDLANSAVGGYVIALAKRAGVKTLAIVSREDSAEAVRRLGADLVLVDGDDLGERAVAALGEARLKLLFEGIGDPAQVARIVPVVENGGMVVSFASVTGQTPAVPLPDLIYRGVTLRSFYILTWLQEKSREELERVYRELADLVAQGLIGAEVEATYPLEEHTKAFTHAQQVGRNGKILFTPKGA